MPIRLQILLSFLGTLFAIASRLSSRFRAQLTRALVLEIRTLDGVAHHFVFARRTARGARGRATSPDTAIVFATAHQALTVLASPDGPRALIDGLLEETITLEGSKPDLQLFSWFGGLAQSLSPLAKPLRLPATPPGGYTDTSSSSPGVSSRITREPSVTELDPTWISAARARASLRMMRAAAGEELPPF